MVYAGDSADRAMITTLLLALVEVFVLVAFGFFIRKLGYLEEADIGKWSRVLIDFFFPLLSFQSFVRDLDTTRLIELLPLPIIGFSFMAIGALIGLILLRFLKSKDPDVKKTFLHLCTAHNFGSLPLFIVSRLWGDEGLVKLFFLDIGSNIAFFTIAVGFLRSKTEGETVRDTFKNIVTPNIAAICAGLIVALAGGGKWFPIYILDIMKKAGQASLPMAMMLIGAALVGVPFRKDLRDISLLSFIRLGLFPLLTIPILLLLRLPSDIYRVALIVCIMPVSMQAPLFIRRYGGSPDFAASAILYTTLISLLSIPFWFALFA